MKRDLDITWDDLERLLGVVMRPEDSFDIRHMGRELAAEYWLSVEMAEKVAGAFVHVATTGGPLDRRTWVATVRRAAPA